MKKWFKFFFIGFFSHKLSKEGARRGYTNCFLGFILALVFLWTGFIGADMLPFGTHYNNSPDFVETVHNVFANDDVNKRIDAKIEEGVLKLKKHDGTFGEKLLINTFDSDADKQNYSSNDCNIVVDSRPANSLAEVEAYCVSNDGKDTVISYRDYLTLSDVARLNFDFKLKYTGNALELNDELVGEYRTYVDGLGGDTKEAAKKLEDDLAQNTITKAEYDRGIYELYFVNYYPEISEYESTSKVPLLRNYYYHQYISQGATNYLFIFDDYMTGSFETKAGINVAFYGFYGDMENGAIVTDGASQDEANELADSFIKNSFAQMWFLNAYAYAMNVISLVPFIALMLMVAALLAYSVLKLRGVESVRSLGATFKIIGSFVLISGVISAVLSLIIAFFVPRGMINVLPLVLFFVTLLIRSIVFVVKESKLYAKQQLEKQKAEQTEV